jgi:hypothetical protein
MMNIIVDAKENTDVIKIVDQENEELDWLAPPPKSNAPKTVEEDSTIRELRYMLVIEYMVLNNMILFLLFR